ncbi:hypothetical protein JQK19_19060, partial [Chromobacterium violaceum]|nr:hypothetical protein [Chromobacterium violaceum]
SSEVQGLFDAANALNQQVGTFMANKAAEAKAAKDAADKAQLDPSKSETEKAQLQAAADDAAKWAPGGSYSQILTAVTAGIGGNLANGLSGMAQNAGIAYLQGLGAQEVKALADDLERAQSNDPDHADKKPEGEVVRAVLHAALACAGAEASGQSCGAGAAGGAASVALNNALDKLQHTDADKMTAEQKLQRENLVNGLLTGLSTATGGAETAATTVNAAKTEMENNALTFARGTSERVKGAATEVAGLLGKGKGQVSRKDIDNELNRLKKLIAKGDLSSQEEQNIGALWMSVVQRASLENLMTPNEIVGSRAFMMAAISSMAFSGGGNGGRAVSKEGEVELPRTRGTRTAYGVSEGEASVMSVVALKQRLYKKELDAIAAQDGRLAKVISGSADGYKNFGIGTGSVEDANRLGQLWVGDGARPMGGVPGGLVSADGTRSYRPPAEKNSRFAMTGIQANFEMKDNNGKVIRNGHLNVRQ